MNPYYYLFYKLSRFLNKKGNNEWGPIYGISIFFVWTIILIYIKIIDITKENAQGINKTIIGIVGISFFVVNCIIFQNKRRVKSIMSRYREESEISRIMGSILIIIYELLSLALLMFI